MNDLLVHYEQRLPKLKGMGSILKDIVQNDLYAMLDEKKVDDRKSLDILYHPPRVERLYKTIQKDGVEYKLSNHFIHPEEELIKCLMHPHPWPSVIEIIEGAYEMGIGFGNPNGPEPEIFMKITLTAGSSYEMLHPFGRHYVRPLSEASKSVMLMGEKRPAELFTLEQEFDISANQIIPKERKLGLMSEFRETLSTPHVN